LASNPVQVNPTLLVVFIFAQLIGAVPVTEGFVVSIVKVIHVELPRVLDSVKIY
jgi:hypothetical protein